MSKLIKKTLLTSAGLAAIAVAQPTAAQTDDSDREASTESFGNTIVVTARGREEDLQDIPESIIALDAEALELRGIKDVEGVVNQTPNFIVRETFRSGVTFFTIRGISTGQQGWAPITYVVDGVKIATLDAINQGALFDIERIEVLKGPQGGLYGAGAIAGAINVVTKEPTNDFSGQVIASYANGNDLTLRGTVSGPLVEDTLLFKLSGFYRNSDGLTDTIQGDDIDFEEQATVRGRLLFTPSDTVSFDLRASYTDIEAGAATQGRFTDISQVNTFNRALDPSRGILGIENRTFFDASAKIDVEFPFATLTSTTGYLDLDQDLYGSVSWTAEPGLGEPSPLGLFGPIFGANALPATDPLAATTPFDQFQDLFDNFEIFTQDIRLVSDTAQPIRWLVGAEYIKREAQQRLGVGFLLGPTGDTPLFLLNRIDDKDDEIWGVFGQLQFDLTDQLELTVSGRYDRNSFDTMQLDGATGNLVQQVDPDGNLVDALTETDDGFQPKITLAYDASEDFKLYATYARGFRFGFFNTGNLTQQETTDNFELGFRSTLADGDLSFNGSVFYINYSDQQVSSVIAAPPFRQTTNIPSTDIYGVEMDFTWQPTDVFQMNGSVGWLDANRSGGGEIPVTPKWTANLGAQLNHPVSEYINFVSRFDWRYQGDHISLDGAGNVFDINAVNLIDVRAGFESDSWRVMGFAKNLLSDRLALDPVSFGPFFVRDYNDPVSYGIELSYRF